MLKLNRNGLERRRSRFQSSLIPPEFDAPMCAPVDGKIALSGISNAGVRIDVYVDDIKVAVLSATDNLTGSWSIPVPITPGPHSIRVEDEAGDSMTKNVNIPAVGCNKFKGGLTIDVCVDGVKVTVGGLNVAPGSHRTTIRIADSSGNSVTQCVTIPVDCGEMEPIGVAASETSRLSRAKASPKKSHQRGRLGKS